MILHLTLHRRHFDQIAAGEKIIEYREIKPYWTRRIVGRRYAEIHFRNGYAPAAPFMRVEYLGYFEDENHYCLRLGRILEIRNHSLAT